MRVLIIITFSLLLMVSCMQENPIKDEYKSYIPKDINDGWNIAKPEEVDLNAETLEGIFKDFHNDESIWMVRSLSVYRYNKLVAETYTRDESDRVELREFWSCTKQIMGILTGIAIEKELIESINDPISKYLPELIEKYPEKGRITIKHLLMMRSGLDFENYGINGDDAKVLQEIPESFVEYSLAKPFYAEPGEEFRYKDSDPMILSAIIQKAAGKPTDEWADEVLFSKIGLQNYDWIRYKTGITIGSFGFLSTPREIAKICQLVLNDGNWNGESIVSDKWLEQMISPLSDAGDKKFGYLWWSYPQHGTYFMSGNGRQLFFVFPDKELIVGITSEPRNQGDAQLSTPKGREIAKSIYNASY